MAKPANDTAAVTAHVNNLNHPLEEVIQALRQVILSSDPAIAEHIKWNAPAFYYTGDMAPFDPKEYKRDIAVMHLRQQNQVLLIFPTGEKIGDLPELFESNPTDGRRMVVLHSLEDLQLKSMALQQAIQQWLQRLEK